VELQQLSKRLNYREGSVQLRDGLATLSLNDGFRYLDPAGTETLLTGIWGNPSTQGRALGTIVPKDFDPFSDSAWCVLVEFSEDGYVSDSDAEKINYDDLLASMKKDTLSANEERRKNGYPPVELIGWAVPPRYDSGTHKFYWAKELHFGEGQSENTLNYNIRVLGRRGVLNLNVIGSMKQLPLVQSATPDILAMVNFNPGNAYTDYKPGTDKLASYGLAALVAGGIATKMGFFKWAVGLLIAFKKVIPLAVIAVFAFIKRIFVGKPAQDPLQSLPTSSPGDAAKREQASSTPPSSQS
jgi:uncharacterized membrane-anchored protein